MFLRAKSETNSNSQATDSAVVSFRWSSIQFLPIARIFHVLHSSVRRASKDLTCCETCAKQKGVRGLVIWDSGVTQMGKARRLRRRESER